MSQKIIAIDDSDIAQDFIRATLADIGFDNVTGFQDPLKALDAIKLGSKPADLILLDIMMPEMDGIELCARIRAIDAWHDVPIIMLTSRKDMNSLTQAFMAGANDYVTKPFDRFELQARMRSCLRLKSELDRRRASERRQAPVADADVFSETPVGIGDVIGTKAGFNASLLSLGVAAQKQIGLVALKVDDIPAWVAAPPSDRREVLRRVAEVRGHPRARLVRPLGRRSFLPRVLFCHSFRAGNARARYGRCGPQSEADDCRGLDRAPNLDQRRNRITRRQCRGLESCRRRAGG